jgi:NADH:ubiquinone oxidoreductase subunit
VEYGGSSIAAPETVPMLWHAWLRGHREAPPTAAELQAEEERQLELQRRVAVLKAADEKLRMQEVAERRMSGRTEVETDMSAAGMLRDLETEAQQATWQGGAKRRQPP